MSNHENKIYDVVVVGAGIAGLSAAISARQHGASVLMIEKSPIEKRGGNTRFSDAQIRYPHEPDEYCAKSYSKEGFRADLMRISSGRADESLVDVMVDQASDTIDWLTGLGVKWERGFPHPASYRRKPLGGGKGLIDTLFAVAEEIGVTVAYDTSMVKLITDDNASVVGIRSRDSGGYVDVYSRGGVILASGGFQANVEMRARYLGEGADSLILRGSKYNTGECLEAALAVDALPAGQWNDFHSAMIDARSPESEGGVMAIYIYQLGILVNREGKRFIDEGEDYRDHTYVKFSKRVLREPGGTAYVIFDQKIYERKDDWKHGVRTPFQPAIAESVEELAEMIDVPRATLLHTIESFNASITSNEFDPTSKDGKATQGILPPKSNWALPIDTPPFFAFPVTGGITFTFGGLKVDRDARVLNRQEQPIRGLYAAGEPIGGLYYNNYPGATSVLRGAVFGRLAGHGASVLASLRNGIAT